MATFAECTETELILAYIGLAVCVLLCCQMIIALGRFIYVHCLRKTQDEDASMAPFLLYSGIVLIVTTILCLIGKSIGSASYGFSARCLNVSYSAQIVIWYIFMASYAAQWWLVLAILFYRVYYVFYETAFQLSTCTVRVYVSILGFTLIFFPATIVLGIIIKIELNPYSPLWSINVAFCMLLLIATSVSMSGLFIIRLVRVYRQANTENDVNSDILKAITKNTVLMIVSTVTALIPPILLLVEVSVGGHYAADSVLHFCLNGAATLDAYTNFLCIVLSYSSFQAVYSKMCKCWDNRVKERFLQREHIRNSSRDNSVTNAAEMV